MNIKDMLGINNETTNPELIQKIKIYLSVDEKELMKLKKDTLLQILEYLKTTEDLLEEKTANATSNMGEPISALSSDIPAHLSITVDLLTKKSIITLTGNKKGEKVSEIIESLTEDQIKILSKHVHKKLARGTETYFDFVTRTDEFSLESFIESLKKDKEVKTHDKDLLVLMSE